MNKLFGLLYLLRPSLFAVALFTSLLIGSSASLAQQGKLLDQKVGAQGGYSVLRVWGTAHEMGYAQGFMLPEAIIGGVEELKELQGGLYAIVKAALGQTIWSVAGADEEVEGIVAGVKAAQPSATIDAGDIKVLNAYGDWAYACRSHSTWGSFVEAPVRTLSTRRLDFGSPVDMVYHHAIVARDPKEGVQWVNLQWPGFAAAVTGVNEYGTLSSLHDYNSKAVQGAHLPRSLLVRFALTVVDGLPIEKHLDTVYDKLQAYTISTGTFLNVYVPQGHGGVLTCSPGGKCSHKRVAQDDFHNGEVLLTANTQTDGHSAPSDDSFMDGYYRQGGKKSIEDHYALMGHGGLHLVTVAYRDRGDMTIWFEGRTGSGVTETVKLEWSELYDDTTTKPQDDAGPNPPSDGGVTDDARTTDPGDDDGSDGCSVVGSATPGSLALLGLLLLLLARWMVRRGRLLDNRRRSLHCFRTHLDVNAVTTSADTGRS